MQDVQNIPNPDVNSTENEDDFGSHSRVNEDVERPEEDVPVPPESHPPAPVEEPPTTEDRPPIEEDETAPKYIV